MKVINTYIVTYEHSYAQDKSAILFECKHQVYYIKYDNLEFETFKKITRELALTLIKK